MYKRTLLTCFLLLAVLSTLNAGVFTRMNDKHWAWESVEQLMSKGILSADDFAGFEGKRNITRYEFAVTFSRFLAHVAQKMNDGSIIATKADLAGLNKITEEFATELTLLGFKNDELENDLRTIRGEVSQLKNDVHGIKKEMVDEQEKVKLSGNWLVRSTWKSHKNDWATNAFSGAAQPGNSNNHAMETQVRFRFDAQIDENISMGARFRLLHKNGDNVTGAYTRNSTWGLNGIGGPLGADNTVDTAFLKIKKLFSDRDEMFFGRGWYWIGHGMMMNAFLDRVQYKRAFNNDITLTAQYFYDRHTGSYKDNGDVDFRGVWNLYGEKVCNGRHHYLSLYAQDEANQAKRRMGAGFTLGNTVAGHQSSDKRRDVEFGSSGRIGSSDKWSYDLSFVYTDYQADIVSTPAAPNIDVNLKGWQGMAALNWRANSQVKTKLQYAFGDDETVGGYALVNDARYVYSHETPYEDISRGNGWFNTGLRNMCDLKLQVEYTPENASKHYFRVVGDWLHERKDTVRNDLTHHLAGNSNGLIPAGADIRNTAYDRFNNLGIADPEVRMIQFEYRYALAKNVKIKVGYINCDVSGSAQKATATQARIAAGRGLNNDYDYQLLWTEIYSTF